MNRPFSVDNEQIREVVKRVVERTDSGVPISFPRWNDDAPSSPGRVNDESDNPTPGRPAPDKT